MTATCFLAVLVVCSPVPTLARPPGAAALVLHAESFQLAAHAFSHRYRLSGLQCRLLPREARGRETVRDPALGWSEFGQDTVHGLRPVQHVLAGHHTAR